MNVLGSLTIFVTVAIMGSWSCDDTEPRACTADYQPVCATFTKTFSNRCELEHALCALARQGFEFTEQVTEGDCCMTPCTLEYAPICGTDGNVHPNSCAMRTARCMNRDWITATDPSNCEDLPQFPGIFSEEK